VTKPKYFQLCTITRRKLQRHGKLTENGIEYTHEAWVTEPCGNPLFGDVETVTGICKSCAAGWATPHNYAINFREDANRTKN
jgi:hypothetical protein